MPILEVGAFLGAWISMVLGLFKPERRLQRGTLPRTDSPARRRLSPRMGRMRGLRPILLASTLGVGLVAVAGERVPSSSG